jgi:hypothetical protein
MQATTTTPSIAIVVSYVSPTNTKGSRVKVEIPRMRIKRFFSLDHQYNSCANQIQAWLYELNIDINAEAELTKGDVVFLVPFEASWEKLANAFGKA